MVVGFPLPNHHIKVRGLFPQETPRPYNRFHDCCDFIEVIFVIDNLDRKSNGANHSTSAIGDEYVPRIEGTKREQKERLLSKTLPPYSVKKVLSTVSAEIFIIWRPSIHLDALSRTIKRNWKPMPGGISPKM
ncbi:unnamed protein product [Lepeophtheirus salmonis]|uniref:(salmon louse) hypothetical protein n=1 Tax=Lepeophtheirus salmonis TaxID=72036 RepID=A0A7R8CPS6_LEPSM|nr:unnamed protein product [Lepeophtheirus salmonis]CAF2842269.1 unnamed protein product [Lepeophtheirus salmonis]